MTTTQLAIIEEDGEEMEEVKDESLPDWVEPKEILRGNPFW